MPELSETDRDFIRDNWAVLSCRAMATELGCNPTTVKRTGERMGLGKKPNPQHVARGKRENVPLAKNPQPDFFSMVDAVFDTLATQRQNLLTQLDQLAKLPDDDRGRVALQRNSVADDLRKCEAVLIDVEEIKDSSMKYRPKKLGIADEIETIDEMLKHLDTPDAREAEGRMAGKVKFAAELVKADWSELFTFEDGSVDAVMLTPETVLGGET